LWKKLRVTTWFRKSTDGKSCEQPCGLGKKDDKKNFITATWFRKRDDGKLKR
jgi:hypothetical protein